MTGVPLSIESRHLHLRAGEQDRLHEQARQVTRDRFGRNVFLRAVVEVSNFCRENCAYCGMRRENQSLSRFRASHDQIADLLVHHRPQEITDINIQTGEDPVAVRDLIIPLVRTLRRETPLGISVCLGSLNQSLYHQLREAGATLYIIKFEIAQAEFYTRMKAPGNYQERLEHIRTLAAAGWRVSSGFIAGLPGQTDQDLLDNIALAQQLPLSGCSVSPFIPGESTPLSGAPIADLNLTLNCMALLRLSQPSWFIPAVSALNLAGRGTTRDGYRRGLRTGANLATINLTPAPVRGDYLLYKRDRFIMTAERILSAIEAEELTPSPTSLASYCEEGSPKKSADPILQRVG